MLKQNNKISNFNCNRNKSYNFIKNLNQNITSFVLSFSTFEGIEFLASTADCWSSHHRSFLGMTVHWLDPVTRERKNAVLACMRLKGSHTYDVLAKAILEAHSSFGIKSKVMQVYANCKLAIHQEQDKQEANAMLQCTQRTLLVDKNLIYTLQYTQYILY